MAGPAPRATEKTREAPVLGSAPVLVSFSPSTSLSLPPHSTDHQLIGVAKKKKKKRKGSGGLPLQAYAAAINAEKGKKQY